MATNDSSPSHVTEDFLSNNPALNAESTSAAAVPKTKPKPVVSDKHKPMCNWTLKELKILQTEIKSGERNSKEIQKKILSKTEQEVELGILYCLDLATQLSKELPTRVKVYKKREFKETMEKWLDLMSETCDIKDMINVVYSDALQEMSQNHFSAKECEGVDFEKIYTYIIKCLRGELPPTLDNRSHYVYNQILRQGILSAKFQLANNPTLIKHLKSLSANVLSEMSNEVIPENEVANVTLKGEYNPLKIPFSCLNIRSELSLDEE